MNINKSKSKSVLFLFLIYFFAAFPVHADTGKRSLFAVNSGPIGTQHSHAALAMPGNEQAGLQADVGKKNEGSMPMMILAGIAGNIIGIYGGWKLGKDDDTSFPSGKILGAFEGSVCGSTLGVFLAGNSWNYSSRGKFGSALGGSLLGIAAAVAVTISLPGLVGGAGIIVGLVALAILPPVGSSIFFNKSLRPRSLPKGSALLNLSGGRLGLGIPDIHVRPLPAYGKNMKAEIQFKINLLSIVL